MRYSQNTMKGAAFYAGATFMVIVMNSFAKLLSEVHDPIEIVFYRNIVALVFICAFLTIKRDWHRVKTERPISHVYRSVLGTLSVVLVFHTYKYLPIADATTILYAAPLIVTALSVPMLGERVGLPRWCAVLVGFIGVMVISSPEGSETLTGYFFGIGAATTIALVSVYLRELGKTEDSMTTVFWFMVIGTVLTGLYMPFGGHLPSLTACGIIFIVGTAGLAQQFLKTHGLAMAQAAILTPIQFTGLIWAAFFGVVLYGDWPEANIWIGATIVIGANLFILWREQRKKAMQVKGEEPL
ncbi:MAG TPA: DMT family transporter [Micavibrio sp.]|nr:DMT family transporter [Micavibrio sp.]HIL29012.1 DMT family transporter [Micavibrio sp.]